MTEALALLALVGAAFGAITLMAAGNAAYARREALRKWTAANGAAMQRFAAAIASMGTAFAATAAGLTVFGQAVQAAQRLEAAQERIAAVFGRQSEEMVKWAAERREGTAE